MIKSKIEKIKKDRKIKTFIEIKVHKGKLNFNHCRFIKLHGFKNYENYPLMYVGKKKGYVCLMSKNKAIDIKNAEMSGTENLWPYRINPNYCHFISDNFNPKCLKGDIDEIKNKRRIKKLYPRKN